MIYGNMNEIVENIKKLILGEAREIDLQEIEDFLVNKIEENQRMCNVSKDPFVKEYLEKEKEALEELLYNWRRYVISLIIGGKNNKIKFSAGSKIEKLAKDISYYFQLDKRKGMFSIVKKNIPSFRGSDQIEYGPFTVGDIIFINKKDYDKLKGKGLVEEIVFDV